MEILVVEDGNLHASLIKSLQDLGHTVRTASSADEAWDRLQIEAFRIVIVDSGRDGRGGLDLCRRIRTHSGSSYVYIFLQMPRNAAYSREEGLEAGADDFLSVPYNAPELMTRLRVADRILSLQTEIRQQSIQTAPAPVAEHAPLGAILVAQGVIDRDQLRSALTEQARSGQRLGPILIARKLVTEEQITSARAVQLDVPYVDVANETADPFVTALLSGEDAQRLLILPLSTKGSEIDSSSRVRLAMADTWNIEGIDLIQRATRRRVEPLLASESAIKTAIMQAYKDIRATESGSAMSDSLSQVGGLDGEIGEGGDEFNDEEMIRMSDEAPVVSFVNALLSDAVRRRTSDIHIEPRKKDFQILYRIDGQLHTIRKGPRNAFAPMSSRIKIMAELDISERRLPQDGRMTVRVDGKSVDMRVSTLPTQYGERVVLRVLDRSTSTMSLDKLGFSPTNAQTFERLITQPHGIILVTGPTGSGKTTTLYAALNALKQNASKVGGRNIITCEDPIEYELEGVSQSNVNERAGLTFAKQLRSIMRQDPDVILVGEIRDGETAETAVRAALTGHLVLSTLHCNEAAGAISRLVDIGLPPFLLGSSLVGVVAQRLVRRLCPQCRVMTQAPPDLIASLQERMPDRRGMSPSEWVVYEPGGCAACDGIGTRGRLAIHEVLLMSETIRGMIRDKADTSTIRHAAMRAGMRPLITDGVEKALQGLTSLEDVLFKVGLPDDSPEEPALDLAA